MWSHDAFRMSPEWKFWCLMEFVIWDQSSGLDVSWLVIKRLFQQLGGSGFALKCIQLAPLKCHTVRQTTLTLKICIVWIHATIHTNVLLANVYSAWTCLKKGNCGWTLIWFYVDLHDKFVIILVVSLSLISWKAPNQKLKWFYKKVWSVQPKPDMGLFSMSQSVIVSENWWNHMYGLQGST